MAKLTGSNVLSGGKVYIEMDDQIIGFANSMSCQDNYNLAPIHVIGQFQPIEFVPQAATHSITIDTLVMRTDSLVRHNLEPMTAGSYGFLSGGGNVGKVQGESDSYTTLGPGSGATAEQKKKITNEITSSAFQAGGGRLTLLDGKIFDIRVRDGKSKKAIVEYIDCYCTGGTFTVGQNNIVGRTVNFVALDRRGQLDARSDSNLKVGSTDYGQTAGTGDPDL